MSATVIDNPVHPSLRTDSPARSTRRRVPRSTTTAPTDDRPDAWPAAVLGFVGVHCGLRVELDGIAELVESDELGAALRRARLLRRVLAEHHRVEDEILWPALAARRPDCAHEMVVLEAEHHDLDDALDRLVADPRSIDPVSGILLAHLQHEELVALPVWLDSFTRRDHEWFEASLRRTTPWRDAATMVSWLLDVTPPEAQGVALARVPASLRLAHRWWFRRRYEARHGIRGDGPHSAVRPLTALAV